MASCRGGAPDSLCDAAGSFTGTPLMSVGITTMKMINRTRQTSTSGVTLMFDSSELWECTRIQHLLRVRRGNAAPRNSDPPRLDHAEWSRRRHDPLDHVGAARQQRAE